MTDRLAKLRSRIDSLLLTLEKAEGDLVTPIDLDALSKLIGVGIEWRRMVPEGLTCATPEGLKIYLQSNFLEQPGVRVRQRFTWAHELCHALFYDLKVTPPKKQPSSPAGASLERLCQEGAAYLLVPDILLRRHFISLNPVQSIADIDRVMHDYGVSTDVAVRRIHQVGSIQDGYAVLLLREAKGDTRIEAVCFGGWLRRFFFEIPEIGGSFRSWSANFMRNAIAVDGRTWKSALDGEDILLVRSRRSPFSEIAELRHQGHAASI